MSIGFMFLFNSVLLGVGLAMDAFSVSLANGLNEPQMGTRRMCGIAGVFAFFQALMPMTGWVCIHTIVSHFQAFEKLIPWIALVLLLYIGGSMLKEGLAGGGAEEERCGVGFMALFIQGVATSIDALSVGFTIAEYDFFLALLEALIIAMVTFVICLCGLHIGKKVGVKLAGKANILGGVILIFIGLEIFVTGVEMFRKLLDQGEAGDNVGLLLRGIDKNEIKRGMVICHPGQVKEHSKFKAEVYILKKEEGGRHTPFHNKYRPQFYIRTLDVTGEITLPEGTEMVMPGDNVTIEVELIYPVACSVGLRFAIREGGRTVGAGQITELEN